MVLYNFATTKMRIKGDLYDKTIKTFKTIRMDSSFS